METTLQIPIIIDALEKERLDKSLLSQIKSRGWKGYSIEKYNKYAETHPFFKDYDLTVVLREQHDREVAACRELRDISIRVTKEPLWSRDNLTLREKWEELLSVVIEHSEFEYGRNFALFRHWLAEEKEWKEESVRRTFIRPDGNIGVELRRERVKVTDEFLACQSLLNLSVKQVKTFHKQNKRYLDSLSF